jgi:hypothetical protein
MTELELARWRLLRLLIYRYMQLVIKVNQDNYIENANT